MPRPLRLLLSLTTSLLAVTLLLYVTLGGQDEQKYEGVSRAPKQSSVKALFAFTSPGSLFPPSAIISLTDDNSTFFLARPADFGPTLPSDGLSGPLWIGSGFAEDTLTRGGELGCSDIPGWDSGSELFPRTLKTASATKSRRTGPLAEKKDKARRASTVEGDALPSNDGTDDHLHQALEQGTRHSSDHADIQSLQESAEISGKVVLLQRGGCGFLAKVEWAQRRGAVAVVYARFHLELGLAHSVHRVQQDRTGRHHPGLHPRPGCPDALLPVSSDDDARVRPLGAAEGLQQPVARGLAQLDWRPV